MTGWDPHAIACRRLWAAVVMMALGDYWRDYRAAVSGRSRIDPAEVLESARRYFESRKGHQVLSLAGIDPDPGAISALLSIITGDVRPATVVSLSYSESAEG